MRESDSNVHFRLSVWAPHRASRSLRYSPTSNSEGDIVPGFSPNALYEEVYAWDPGGIDVLSSINDSRLTNRIRMYLLEWFSPDLPPTARSIQKFSETLIEIERELDGADSTTWAELAETLEANGRSFNPHADAIRTFLLHANWISETFKDMPGVCVAIR